MNTDFELDSEIKSDCLVLRTVGYINNVGGETIAKRFDEAFNDGIKRVVVNFAGTGVVNSIGISYLLEVIEKLMHSNGKLVFTNMAPPIEKTFNIMGLFTFAETAANEEEALAKAKA